MASSIYYSCDSHVVEAPEVFDGLVDRFGDRAPRVVDKWKDREAVFVAWPSIDFAMSVGRLGIAGANLNLPETKEKIARGWDLINPGVKDPVAPPLRAGAGRHRRRGHVPLDQHAHLHGRRRRSRQRRLPAPQRLDPRLLLARPRTADRRRLRHPARRRPRHRRAQALRKHGHQGRRHPLHRAPPTSPTPTPTTSPSGRPPKTSAYRSRCTSSAAPSPA